MRIIVQGYRKAKQRNIRRNWYRSSTSSASYVMSMCRGSLVLLLLIFQWRFRRI